MEEPVVAEVGQSREDGGLYPRNVPPERLPRASIRCGVIRRAQLAVVASVERAPGPTNCYVAHRQLILR